MSDAQQRTEWTAMAEAISFISATLGETYTAAQGNGLYWSALGVQRPDGVWPYPVGLENLGSEVKLILFLLGCRRGSFGGREAVRDHGMGDIPRPRIKQILI